jgi:tetratricopeptide (TPR) repeat protein
MKTQVKSTQILGLAVIALSVLFLISSVIPVALAQDTAATTTTMPQQTNTSSIAYQVLLAKAMALNAMLSRCLALNISEDLKSEISVLISINISTLSFSDLKSWVINASRLLAEVNKEVRVGGRAYAVGIALERYLSGVKKALENRIRAFEKRFIVNASEVIANMTKARDLKELNKALKYFERDLWAPIKLQSFANASMNTLALALRSVRGVKDAYKHLAVAERVLNITIERLKMLNASEEAIEALQLAIEKIREAKEIVLNVSKQLVEEYNLTEIIRGVVENKTREVFEKVEELVNELQNLRSIASEKNMTKLVEAIDMVLQKLDELRNRIANTTLEDLPKCMRELAEIKAWIRFVKRQVDRIPATMPTRALDDAYNTTVEKAMELLSVVEEMLSYVKNNTPTICIAIYPPPLICDRMYLLRIELMVNMSKELLQEAQQLYEQGRKVEALIIANRAVATLRVARAWLEPLYNMLKRKGQAVATRLGVEVRLQRGRAIDYRYSLAIRVRNNGNSTVTIEKAILITRATASPLQIDIGVSVEPGKEVTVTKTIIMPIVVVGKPVLELHTSAGILTIEVEVS